MKPYGKTPLLSTSSERRSKLMRSLIDNMTSCGTQFTALDILEENQARYKSELTERDIIVASIRQYIRELIEKGKKLEEIAAKR